MEGKKIMMNGQYVQAVCGGVTVRLTPVTDEVIRCSISAGELRADVSSLIIEQKQHPQVTFQAWEEADTLRLRTERVQVSLRLSDACITFAHPDGTIWCCQNGVQLCETEVMHYTTGTQKPIVDRVRTVDGERNFIRNLQHVKDRTAYRAKLYFSWQEGEGIYGLGQGEEGIYNYRGHNQYLYQHNMRIPMPMFLSDRGYGILLDCCSLMTFYDEWKESYLFLDTVDQVEYYFLGGQTPDGIIHDYRYLTGKAQMLPKWAYGYIQSKEQYYTAKELAEVVERYRSLQIPLDCVVQDWNSWKPGHWGEKRPDPKRYGDLKECMDRIHEMHAHAMVSVWPNMSAETEDFEELMEAGKILPDLSTYNAFDEEARELYWKQCSRELFAGGFDSWWCDSTEPFSGPDWSGSVKREPWERYLLVGNEHKKYLDAAQANAFALMHAKGIYENQRKEREDMRVLNLTRSGYASGQKYGAMLWSGDTCASWETLQIQITEGLNMGLSGYPYWTLDIGAFFTVGENWRNRGCGCSGDPQPKWFWQGKYDEGVKDPGYCELYTRWLQMGTFLPMFRSHGTDTPREIWNFGEPGTMFYDAIARFIRLRYELMPYLYSQAAAVHFEDKTIMRSLLFDFAQDPEARKQDQEFLFGPSLLVCPVTAPMYYEAKGVVLEREKKWRCYLPAGCDWYDFWTNEKHAGGQYVEVEAPIDQIPLFVKAGTILPLAQGLQYAMQEPKQPIRMRVYTGSDGSFRYYEDAGNDYGFEKGEYALTEFTYLEASRSLQQGETKGDFPGRKPLRYEVELVE